MSIIKVENVSKVFNLRKRYPGLRGAIKGFFSTQVIKKAAVDNINFTIQQGEIVGYIGPNGAGKSTTIKMLSGILYPTNGTLLVNGIEPYKNRVKNAFNIGVVFGQRTQLWYDIPASESFSLLRYMYRVPEKNFKKTMEIFNDILGIHEFANTPVRQLSLGQRMRADLAASLIHEPPILFLDEPTIGLDVMVKKKVREFIQEINRERKTTIILTTHDMSDIEKLCSRVMVLDKGKIMYDGSLDLLKSNYGTDETITIILDDDSKMNDQIQSLPEIITRQIIRNQEQITIHYDRNQTSSTKILQYFMAKYKLKDFTVIKTEIEEVIQKIYEFSSS